jgi:inosine kinase
MRFPGKRKNKHFFPVTDRGRIPFSYDFSQKGHVYIVGIDQPLVDIEALVSDSFLLESGLVKGESIVLPDDQGIKLIDKLKSEGLINGQYAGGAIGNTLHNFSTLSESESILLGVMSRHITVGDDSYKYLATTSCLVDLNYLRPCDGPIGRAICFITPDGERSFGICQGKVNDFYPEDVPEDIVSGASLLLISAYVLRDSSSPIFKSTMKAVELANAAQVPVILSLGTSGLVTSMREFLTDFIQKYINVVAMNQNEAKALTLETDPLLAADKILEIADMALLTVGPEGLYLAGYVDEQYARETSEPLLSKSIAEYNRYEYSRAMLKKDCEKPIKIYGHINPYMGGPGVVESTNGAGDAALAALLHDMSANDYHREMIPTSPKHKNRFLTYSSLSQISKYANRVSFEVLKQKSPRLLRGLPEREDVLEESYWDR